jgi:hypothetical protein
MAFISDIITYYHDFSPMIEKKHPGGEGVKMKSNPSD